MAETKYYLAVDIGASSGRHILSHMEDGKIVLEEIYRFYNGNDKENGHLVWNTDRLFSEIITGMKKAKEIGKIPVSMGIDTWAVDYVLLDKEDKKLGICYGYRDSRTEGMDKKVSEIISLEDLYARTGIQKTSFNTIYQLMAAKTQEPELLAKAESLLMVPDYLHFLLTGVKKQEYTNATTTQLVSPKTNDWDYKLIEKLGFPKKLFGELSMPGTLVGPLKKEIADEVGYTLNVILPATHDTGSAVMSVPTTDDHALYISSGTWSLVGCELHEADTSREAQKRNFTNEGGYDHRFRFLKNIMGLWMIQSVQKEFVAGYEYPGKTEADSYDFGTLCDWASRETIDSIVPANDQRFLAPESMIAEVQKACSESGQEVPVTPWEISRVIYQSLAACYREAFREIEELTGRKYDTVHIVGGGAKAVWLDELTATMSRKVVLAGPYEATAIGNLGAQMIKDGVFTDLMDFRKCVAKSFEINEYKN